jgi:hypothetical protein
VIDVVMAISRRATSLWLVTPEATFSELVAQAAAELCEVAAPLPPTAH